MNVLVLENITKAYGERTLFDSVSLGINEGDKIGVIGVNGTGKSTLLKIIARPIAPATGTVTKGSSVQIAYLPQTPEFDEDASILAHVLEGKLDGTDDWTTESDARTILNKLGFSDYDRPARHLSGGEKKRVALARTLLNPADVLILDEPTNHLDPDMVLWLEQYLNRYRGVLIMVTHDRYFLDRVTNKILEIDDARLYLYETNYSGFVEKRTQRIEEAVSAEQKRRNILRTELEWLHRGARARSTKQKAHIQRIEELQSRSGPEAEKQVEINSVGSRMGKKTIEIENVSKSFGGRMRFRDFSSSVLRDERIGIIGPNGCGKATLMKIITGLVPPDTGSVTIGETIKIGYFSQEVEDMDGDVRVIDYIRDVAEVIHTTTGTATASQMLERFLFSPAMQYTPVSKLSGGEKRRLYLLRVLMSAPNVLILDEPTNDLDIATLTILEDYLDHFQGIVITVSHDRYFLDRVVRRIFAFEGGGAIRQYEGGYTDYQAACGERIAAEMEASGTASGQERGRGQKAGGASGAGTSDAAETAKDKNRGRQREKKLKFSYMEQKEWETIEDDIAALEEAIADLEQQMQDSARDYTALNGIIKEKEEKEALLEEKMDRWMYLNDLAEKIEAQAAAHK